VDVPEELNSLHDFHGHLGPYATIGFRMGQIARRELGEYKGLFAIVHCSLVPPMRCLVDGVQMTSGCTFGKANIKVKNGRNPQAVFTKGDRTLLVTLKPGLRKAIDEAMSKAHEVEDSLRYFRMAEDDLFDVRFA